MPGLSKFVLCNYAFSVLSSYNAYKTQASTTKHKNATVGGAASPQSFGVAHTWPPCMGDAETLRTCSATYSKKKPVYVRAPLHSHFGSSCWRRWRLLWSGRAFRRVFWAGLVLRPSWLAWLFGAGRLLLPLRFCAYLRSVCPGSRTGWMEPQLELAAERFQKFAGYPKAVWRDVSFAAKQP